MLKFLGLLCLLTSLSPPGHTALPDGRQIHWLRYGSGHVSAIKHDGQIITEFTRDTLHRETRRSQGAQRLLLTEYTPDGMPASQTSRLTAYPETPPPPTAKWHWRRSLAPVTFDYATGDPLACRLPAIRKL